MTRLNYPDQVSAETLARLGIWPYAEDRSGVVEPPLSERVCVSYALPAAVLTISTDGDVIGFSLRPLYDISTVNVLRAVWEKEVEYAQVDARHRAVLYIRFRDDKRTTRIRLPSGDVIIPLRPIAEEIMSELAGIMDAIESVDVPGVDRDALINALAAHDIDAAIDATIPALLSINTKCKT